ncbi:hypothetical protein B0H10DRAFT_2062145, partial [Mycena sp. CBHHK59/15]
TLEMDSFSASVHRPRSVSRGKSVSPGRALSQLQATRDYALGIGLLLIVVILWTSSNFVTQGMYSVTYLNTSAFALYLVPFLLRRWWRKRRGWEDSNEVRRGRAQYQPLAVDPHADREVRIVFTRLSNIDPPLESSDDDVPPLTIRETARLAFIFCFLWFIANWAVNASLDYTSVASATILSSMSGFFTLGIGRFFRVEMLSLAKIGAVLTSTAPVLGDSLALISAIFYALYVILLKVRIRSESRVDMQLFFGFVGLFNVLSLPKRQAVAALAINMAITLSSDYLYVLAMLKTTPLVVTVGLSLTIPLAVLGDFILGKFTRGQVIFGAILVLISFVVVGLDNEKVKAREGDGRSSQGELELGSTDHE